MEPLRKMEEKVFVNHFLVEEKINSLPILTLSTLIILTHLPLHNILVLI